MQENKDNIITPATVENYAKGVLALGMKMLKNHPEEFRPADVIAAQKLLIDKRKIELQESSLKDSIARLFGGIGTIEDGEMLAKAEIADKLIKNPFK